MLGQLIVSGLASGFSYALIALAMVIVYKTSEVLNFAQGELAMFSTFFAYSLLSTYHLPFGLAFGATLLFAFLLGAVVHALFLQPAKDPNPLGLIIITLGAEMILYGLASWIWGSETKGFPSPLSNTAALSLPETNLNFGLFRLALGEISISHLDIFTFAVALVLMALLAFFFRLTRLGVAMKATAQNPTAAEIMGIRTGRIYTFTWGLSSLIGAVAGMLTATVTTLDPNLMMDPLLKGFAAAVLGGMNSLPGCVVGGCLLGVIENIAGGYLPSGFKSVIAFLVIILVLTARPSGLLGRHYIKKV